MPKNPPKYFIYPMDNYDFGQKAPLYEKDISVKDRMARMERMYNQQGLRRYVEGIILVHYKCHPHLLLFQIGNTYFKLPGGRLKGHESEIDGLKRKLTSKLGTPNSAFSINWTIGTLASTWWRPNFETVLFPYIPPQVVNGKECRKMFMVQLPRTGILGVPKNLKLLAVPLFELYENAHRYGSTIASVPSLISHMKIICCDRNGKPIVNSHINAYHRENIHIHKSIKQQQQTINNNKNNNNNISSKQNNNKDIIITNNNKNNNYTKDIKMKTENNNNINNNKQKTTNLEEEEEDDDLTITVASNVIAD